ncbi:YbjN domain-containing protein [Polyangium jinanense]|uniref:YbjN domain-containing protein n=1 Tax=Polyangium jinanense TaxID=2829994 RepID=A0A9X4AQJ2_9BACT|nr:YbjN domain-containing protein [Polyangium jinanense]MDC3953822.1 YbjN domain-containing protein [Polyangium jinanense]MDC3979057.1 YbjN domain-containing protein [Polyangium jinanense]
MTLDEIRAVLEAQQWPVERLSEATLRSRFRSKDRIFPLFVHLEPLFVTFAVIPYARLPEEPETAEAVMTRLLKLNREINLAKYSVDDDGDIILSVEYRIEHLDPSEIRDAVDVLSFYADKHHEDVHKLASP